MLTIKKFTFSPLQENTYLVYNEQRDCCIVDPGCYFGNERNELKDYIQEEALTPKYLLNTHCHLDHIFGNKFVHQTWGLVPNLHEIEKLVLDFAPTSGKQWGLPFDPYSGPLVYLREHDTIQLGQDTLNVLFTPGHSPGHIAYYCPAQSFILSGDVLFRQSVGRVDLPGGDAPTLIHTIREKFYTLPDDTIVYSGHGPETTTGYEKTHNPFVQAEGPVDL